MLRTMHTARTAVMKMSAHISAITRISLPAGSCLELDEPAPVALRDGDRERTVATLRDC